MVGERFISTKQITSNPKCFFFIWLHVNDRLEQSFFRRTARLHCVDAVVVLKLRVASQPSGVGRVLFGAVVAALKNKIFSHHVRQLGVSELDRLTFSRLEHGPL